MQGTGVIDNFLGVFTRYIDSGFGLLSGEVAFIATTLIVIDVTLAALFWSMPAPVHPRPARAPELRRSAPPLRPRAASSRGEDRRGAAEARPCPLAVGSPAAMA